MTVANAEVDQSIKMNDLARDTVLAIADGISYAIVIPATVKRAVIQRLQFDPTRIFFQHICFVQLFRKKLLCSLLPSFSPNS